MSGDVSVSLRRCENQGLEFSHGGETFIITGIRHVTSRGVEVVDLSTLGDQEKNRLSQAMNLAAKKVATINGADGVKTAASFTLSFRGNSLSKVPVLHEISFCAAEGDAPTKVSLKGTSLKEMENIHAEVGRLAKAAYGVALWQLQNKGKDLTLELREGLKKDSKKHFPDLVRFASKVTGKDEEEVKTRFNSTTTGLENLNKATTNEEFVDAIKAVVNE